MLTTPCLSKERTILLAYKAIFGLSTMAKSPSDVVIVSALRTPLCRSRKGGLAKVPASTLLTAVFEATLHGRIEGHEIEDICIGNCLMPANGFAAMRMAQIVAGIPESVPFHSINRQCSSGLQAVAHVANAIATGQIEVGLGGGVESMSANPMNKMQPPAVDWEAMQENKTALDCLIPMGMTSENVVKDYGLKRQALDEFSVLSHQKASKAQQEGKFDSEIVPVAGITKDDGIRPGTTLEILSSLKPVFQAKGVTTAGNSSQTTDGAAAVLLMTREQAEKRGLPILAIWRGFAVKGVPPRIMGIGPAYAIPAVLEQTGLTIKDIDIFEINEAFASQATWSIDELGIDHNKVNPNGGAIALGHPLGCTGARQIATLLHEMNRTKKRYGVVSMCIGTGMGAAAVLEVEPRSSL